MREIIDRESFRPLLDEKDEAALADSASYSEDNEDDLLNEIDAHELLTRKTNRNKPLSELTYNMDRYVLLAA